MRVAHGGLDESELRALGLAVNQVLDFSANINPLGPSERVRAAAAGVDIAAYPDRSSLGLREALAARLGVGAEQLLIGNGSTELIHLIARGFLGPGERCLILEPTFGEYEAAAALTGAEIIRVRTSEAQDWRWPITDLQRSIDSARPAVVFLCNPNNPTGVQLTRSGLEAVSHAVGSRGLLVIDDAYAPFADQPWDACCLLGNINVAVLRSMTKQHALAGLRLGYLVAQPDVIAEVGRMQHSWSVNAPAQAAGLAALDDDEHVEAARSVIREGRRLLFDDLNRLGLSPVTSAVNYFIVDVGDASLVRSELLERGIAVRDCTSFGLPRHIRIAVRQRHDCERLVSAMREVLAR